MAYSIYPSVPLQRTLTPPRSPQVYHHVGIVIFLWGSSVTKSAWVVWPTLLNSFIHTLMYSYFTAATLGVKIPYARCVLASPHPHPNPHSPPRLSTLTLMPYMAQVPHDGADRAVRARHRHLLPGDV